MIGDVGYSSILVVMISVVRLNFLFKEYFFLTFNVTKTKKKAPRPMPPNFIHDGSLKLQQQYPYFFTKFHKVFVPYIHVQGSCRYLQNFCWKRQPSQNFAISITIHSNLIGEENVIKKRSQFFCPIFSQLVQKTKLYISSYINCLSSGTQNNFLVLQPILI